MNIHDKRRHLEPAVRRRLALLLGDRTLSNGSKVSNAVATIVAHDLAYQPKKLVMDPERLANAYADHEILEIAAAVELCLLSREADAFQLPSSKVISPVRHATGLYFDREVFHPWAGREGLYLTHEIDRNEDSPNAEKLRQAIYQKMQTLEVMDVPRICLEDIKIVKESHKWRDVVTVPMRGSKGKQFAYEMQIEPVPFLLEDSINSIASALAEKASDQWKHRDLIDRQYEIIAQHMETLRGQIEKENITFFFEGVRVQLTGQSLYTVPMFTVLNNSLRPEQWSDYNCNQVMIPYDFKSIMNQYTVQRRRAKILNKTKAENGRGKIDSITLKALQSSKEDVAETLKKLGSKQRVKLKMGLQTGRFDNLNLSWRNGVVMGSFCFDKYTAWSYGSFILKNKELPASVISSLIGRRLNELVEHPLIDPEVHIRSVTGQNGGWLKINANIKTYVFNPETGEIIGEEAAAA